jgi:co-chaperonin GroES (HSP10)
MSIEFDHTTSGEIEPLTNSVIVEDIENEREKISNGIIILNETGKDRGIRPRWARVSKVGPDQLDVHPGQWVLINHGRWTRGVKLINNGESQVFRKVDPDEMLMVSDTSPFE